MSNKELDEWVQENCLPCSMYIGKECQWGSNPESCRAAQEGEGES